MAMRPDAPFLNVPPKLYKHFAVLTVVITACVALFAEAPAKPPERQEPARQERKQAPREPSAGAADDGTQADLRDNRTSPNGVYEVELAAPSMNLISSRRSPGEEPSARWLGSGALAGLEAIKRPLARKLPPVLPPGAPAGLAEPAPGPSADPTVSPPAAPGYSG